MQFYAKKWGHVRMYVCMYVFRAFPWWENLENFLYTSVRKRNIDNF